MTHDQPTSVTASTAASPIASPPQLTATSVLDRAIGAPDTAALRALEATLLSACAELRAQPSADEDTTTRQSLTVLSSHGLLKLLVPAAYGGANERVLATPVCIARQFIARESGCADTAFIMQGLGSYPVALAGSDELKRRVLPGVTTGEQICAFALTEPEAGSDVSGMQTRAEPADGGVRLFGTKHFISNAGLATSYVVFAREGADERGKPRFSAFWLPGDARGLRCERQKMLSDHPIGRVILDGAFVPDAHRVGAPGEGLRIALTNLDTFRPTVGAAAAGMADRALEVTVDHLKRRTQFGRPLADQQGLRFAVAQAAADHLAAQAMVYRAATLLDEGRGAADAAAVGKLLATETAQRVIDLAVQSLGGRGVEQGSDPERLYREVRALRIYEGTSEIQKLVIARAVFGAKGQ